MRNWLLVAVLAATGCGGDDSPNLPGGGFDGVGRIADASTVDARPPAIDAMVQVQAAVINEVVIDDANADDMEFIEIFGEPSTDYSALTVVQIESDNGGTTGNIISTYAVGTTDANGFWTTGLLAGELQNGSGTYLLVEGFVAPVDDDLDTDNDGTLDVTPWTTELDGVAFDDGGASTFYNATVVSLVGGAARVPDGTDTNTAADWLPIPVDGVATGPTEANATPGAANTAGL